MVKGIHEKPTNSLMKDSRPIHVAINNTVVFFFTAE